MTVYHLGDTALFGDLRLIGERHCPDVALVPIGGHFTMDRDDAAYACEPDRRADRDPVPLQHLPPIETDAEAFKPQVESETSSKVVILEPGETYEV